MYTYITNEDLLRHVKDEFLTNLKAGMTQTELDKEEAHALTTVWNKLRGRYDINAIKALEERNEQVVNWVTTIMVYNLHRRQNNRGIPEHVSADYADTIQWLNDIRDGKEHPDLPALPLNEDGSAQLGSNELRSGSQKGTNSGDFFLPQT